MSSAAPAIVHLVARIERFCAQPSRKKGEEVSADLVELRRGMNLLELKFSEMAVAFAATDQYDMEGSISPIHWIRHQCHLGGGAAADRIAVGEQLSNMPESAEAVAGGEIGFTHLALIARTATALTETGSNKQFDETHLLKRPKSSASAGSESSATTSDTPTIPRVTRRSRRRGSRSALFP